MSHQGIKEKEDDSIIIEQVAYSKANKSMIERKEFEEMKRTKEKRLRPSIEDPPILELKKLPYHLKYAFLGNDSKLLVIIGLDLKAD